MFGTLPSTNGPGPMRSEGLQPAPGAGSYGTIVHAANAARGTANNSRKRAGRSFIGQDLVRADLREVYSDARHAKTTENCPALRLFLEHAHLELGLRELDVFLVEAELHGTGDVPVHVPVVLLSRPRAQDEIEPGLRELVELDH